MASNCQNNSSQRMVLSRINAQRKKTDANMFAE